MLVLTRKSGESILIGDNIKVQVIEINKDSIKIGISAPKDISIFREEIIQEIIKENIKASGTSKEQGAAIEKILKDSKKQ